MWFESDLGEFIVQLSPDKQSPWWLQSFTRSRLRRQIIQRYFRHLPTTDDPRT